MSEAQILSLMNRLSTESLLTYVIGWGSHTEASNQYSAAQQIIPKKDKASSLDIAPLTILNSGTLQPRKWQQQHIHVQLND